MNINEPPAILNNTLNNDMELDDYLQNTHGIQ